MYNKLIFYYLNHYYTHPDKFLPLCSRVAIKVLSHKYNVFLSDSEIQPIENIPEAKRNAYIELGNRFASEFSTPQDIQKSAYALELIASTF